VTITRGFWIGQTEVTQEAWQWVMGSNQSYFKRAKLPVENIDWDQARNYCQAAGMRLLTEAEWEYAARAGSTAGLYGDLDKIAWYGGNSGGVTHEVGKKLANPWGLYDTVGNVWEWVEDWLGPYPSGSITDPRGPENGKFRALRGGGYGVTPKFAHTSNRGRPGPLIHGSLIGVRCAGN
jgi:formylglycine-generating enzyme required for sulfatase activity